MKTIICSIAALLIGAVSVTAQENMDIKKETTTKKVVVKDTKVETKVINDVEVERSVIVVEGDDSTNQNAKVITQKEDNVEVVMDEISEDPENEELIEEIEEDVETQMKDSKKAQMQKVAEEKEVLMNKDEVKAMEAMKNKDNAPKAKMKNKDKKKKKSKVDNKS